MYQMVHYFLIWEETGCTMTEPCIFFSQLVLGMEYVHSLNIIHCDLKLENLLVDVNEKLRIIDFGLSFFDGDQDKYFDGFTPYYVPPELADIKQKPSFAGDIWSAGIIFYALLTGTFPFPESGPDPGEFSIFFPKEVRRDEKKLLLCMLNLYPEHRPSFSDISKDRLLNKKSLTEKIKALKPHRSEASLSSNNTDGPKNN
uniref:Protein kinase domain-containing protein n=1 Tax=Paramoeba aestuarina TaxID=180227 RepID=A0A7S4KS31_9EUKA|mmetsp:Transcript_24016/g.37411  ORF Transcript_24016/g.37411 Transcript_24016/m.37411 type:complete len:200 (+) Transcript_24016:357-956(+)